MRVNSWKKYVPDFYAKAIDQHAMYFWVCAKKQDFPERPLEAIAKELQKFMKWDPDDYSVQSIISNYYRIQSDHKKLLKNDLTGRMAKSR